MASRDDENRSAGFFQLPRELRNLMYSHLAKDVVLDSGIRDESSNAGIQILAKNAAIPKLARINKQFREEYEKQIKSIQSLAFKDLGGSLTDCTRLSNVKRGSRFKKAELDLLALCTESNCAEDECSKWYDLSGHNHFISEVFSTLPHLEEVIVRLYIHCEVDDPVEWAPGGQAPTDHKLIKELIDITGLSRLELYPVPELRCHRTDIYNTQEGPVRLWTQGDGWATL